MSTDHAFQAALECLEAKDRAYREMLSIALTQLHQAQADTAALQARYDALREEHRRALDAMMAND